jgi:hypothetical protein
MVETDLDSYREMNDIGPDDPAPREPEGEPHRTTDEFHVWQFDSETSQTVPDTFVVARDPEPLDFRMWVFVGREEQAHFVMRASHRYSPTDVTGDRDDCCEVLFEGQSLAAVHCPESVQRLVADLTGAEVVTSWRSPGSESAGPINY